LSKIGWPADGPDGALLCCRATRDRTSHGWLWRPTCYPELSP